MRKIWRKFIQKWMCLRKRCDYYTHYLQYGPPDLDHHSYHIAAECCESVQLRLLAWYQDNKEGLPPFELERECEYWERRVRALSFLGRKLSLGKIWFGLLASDREKRKISMHPEIMNAIKNSDAVKEVSHCCNPFCICNRQCLACTYYDNVDFDRRITLIKKYGVVCLKCKRKAGVAW